MNLELYYYDQCPFCQVVLRKIKGLELTDKITYKNVLENPQFRQYHINKTQRTTVPCLYIDDKPMFESDDICDWLENNKSSI